MRNQYETKKCVHSFVWHRRPKISQIAIFVTMLKFANVLLNILILIILNSLGPAQAAFISFRNNREIIITDAVCSWRFTWCANLYTYKYMYI